MELRVLRYFLAVTQYGNFTTAATMLHLTQPTLSRQIQELEDEMGAPLLIRGKRETRLTEAGKYMRSRAAEILALAEKTKACLKESQTEISGDVHIAGGETRAMSLLARAMKKTRDACPGVRFHIFSGKAEEVSERLDNGVADFGVFIRPANLERYEYLHLPQIDTWGLLMRRDHPLAGKEYVTPSDLATGLSLITSQQRMMGNELAGWLGSGFETLNVVATYNLLYNAALMVREGVGAALCIDGIVKTPEDGALCFRPLKPALRVGLDVAWKKDAVFSRAAAAFGAMLRQEIAGEETGKSSSIPLN